MVAAYLCSTELYAVCPGGEGAALKAVGLKGLAGSNPVDGARAKAPTECPQVVNKRGFICVVIANSHKISYCQVVYKENNPRVIRGLG